MVYWVEFGNGVRERAYDSLTKTRKHVRDYMDFKKAVDRTIPYAVIYESKNAETPVGIIETKKNGFAWVRNGKSSYLGKDGVVRKAKDGQWHPFGL